MRDGLRGFGQCMGLPAGSTLWRCTPWGSNAGNSFGGAFGGFGGRGLTPSLGYWVRMSPLCRGAFGQMRSWLAGLRSFGGDGSFEGGGLPPSLVYWVRLSLCRGAFGQLQVRSWLDGLRSFARGGILRCCLILEVVFR